MVETKITSTEEKPKEATITISKSVLENLQKSMKELEKNNELLMATADKKALAHYYSRNKESLPSIVRLRMIENKLVVSWRTIKNEIYQVAGTQKWVENQIIELTFQDKSTVQMPYVNFIRNYSYIQSKIVNSTIDELTKETTLKVIRQDNGEELTIGVTFVN